MLQINVSNKEVSIMEGTSNELLEFLVGVFFFENEFKKLLLAEVKNEVLDVEKRSMQWQTLKRSLVGISSDKPTSGISAKDSFKW